MNEFELIKAILASSGPLPLTALKARINARSSGLSRQALEQTLDTLIKRGEVELSFDDPPTYSLVVSN